MATPITIPAVGESITEGILSRWLVDDGAYVAEGTPIYELETDKISSEIEAEVSGVISITIAEGEVVEIGGEIGSIDTSASAPAGGDAAPAAAAPEAPAAQSEESAAPAPSASPAPAAAASTTGDADPAKHGPAVRKLLAEHGLDPAAVQATGPGGRITKVDIERHLAAPQPAAAASSASDDEPDETRKRMTPLRKKIAARLVQAQRTAAILTTFNEVDMKPVMDLRKQYKDAFAETHNTGLGFMGFFTKATCLALAKYPLLNAFIDGDELVEHKHVHMGIAVGTPKGLVVPVLRKADEMNLADIESGIRGYAKRARDGKLAIDDLTGGTFTITNGGVYGSMMSTPILNPPQSGILGMHAIKERPVAINGEVVIRPMMYLALSYDHRIVDGAEAVGFLVRIKEILENPERMILDL